MLTFIFNISKEFSLLLIFIHLFIAGCKDFIEPDLSGKKVLIISPKDNLTAESNSLYFSWEKLEGASKYRIIIAKPSFINLEQIIVDSLVLTNNIQVSVSPGNYQWKVRPENNSSFGEYSSRYFQIDSTLNISNLQLVLNSPTNDYATSEAQVSFSWFPLYNADQYSLKVFESEWDGNALQPEVITQDSFVFVNFPEGKYIWGVRGENNTSNTLYSQRSLWIDFTNPETPTLIIPNNEDTISNGFEFQWQQQSDSGSPLTDSIFIYSDSLLNNLVTSEVSISNNFILNGSVQNSFTYWWIVRTYDMAKNSSNSGIKRSFFFEL
jgi:hypothetical protein